jgi:NAD(P)-dependent dehydrogenase (short-subunit alcohol dehydrogenase family)
MTGGAGQVVVITGGTRGIGRGMAAAFLERGCRIVFTGRSAESVDRALEGEPYGGREEAVLGLACDSGDADALQGLWDRAVDRFGRVDVWINNAALMSPRLPFVEQGPETIDAVIRTNVIGAMLATRIALAGMRSQPGGGQIFNFEGFGSDGTVSPGFAIYGTSKAAMSYFAKAIARETRGGPVRTGLIFPGIVVTEMITGEREHVTEEQWRKSRRMYEILGDRVETVAPWLAEQVLANQVHGARIAWLTRGKAIGRFLSASLLRRKRASPFETVASEAR